MFHGADLSGDVLIGAETEEERKATQRGKKTN